MLQTQFKEWYDKVGVWEFNSSTWSQQKIDKKLGKTWHQVHSKRRDFIFLFEIIFWHWWLFPSTCELDSQRSKQLTSYSVIRVSPMSTYRSDSLLASLTHQQNDRHGTKQSSRDWLKSTWQSWWLFQLCGAPSSMAFSTTAKILEGITVLCNILTRCDKWNIKY